jgi:hypothetical protein
MNSASQKYRLSFFVDDQQTEVETTGDRLIVSIGKIPDGVINVVIIDLNLLEVPPDHECYFFYYRMTDRQFTHMLDTEMFPKSKAASDWWNEHIGGKLTWAEESAS